MFTIYPDKKIVILSQFDSYINYRMGLKQVGNIVPFPMHLYVKETTEFIKNKIKEGYKVVLWENEMIALISQLNSFRLVDKGGFYELGLIK